MTGQPALWVGCIVSLWVEQLFDETGELASYFSSM